MHEIKYNYIPVCVKVRLLAVLSALASQHVCPDEVVHGAEVVRLVHELQHGSNFKGRIGSQILIANYSEKYSI